MYKRKKRRKIQKTINQYRPISLINTNTKIVSKLAANSVWNCTQTVIYHDQVEFIPDMHSWFNNLKSVNVIHHINRLEKKKIISINTKKHLIKSYTHLWLKEKNFLQLEVRNRGEHPQLNKEHLQKNLQLTSFLTVKDWILSSKIRNETRMSTQVSFF